MAVNYYKCAIVHCWWADLMNLFLELSWAGLVPLAVWKLSFWPHWFFHSSRLPWVSVSTLAELSQWCEEPSGWPWAAVLNLCFTCNWSAFILHLWSIAHMQEVFWNGQIFQHFFNFSKNEQNAVFLSLCYSADWNVCFSESNWGEEGRQLYQGMGSATQNRLQFSEEKHDDNLRPFT